MSTLKLFYIDHPNHYNISMVRAVYQMEREFFPYVKPIFFRKWTDKPAIFLQDNDKFYLFTGTSIGHLRAFIWDRLMKTRRIRKMYDGKYLPDFRRLSQFKVNEFFDGEPAKRCNMDVYCVFLLVIALIYKILNKSD